MRRGTVVYGGPRTGGVARAQAAVPGSAIGDQSGHTHLVPGDLVAGRYRLVQLQPAQDPSGELWQAVDEILARSVAVRIVPADEPRSAAFLDAATRVGALPGRLTTRVYDAAVQVRHGACSLAYVVGEWVPGPWLVATLAEGPLPPRHAVALILQAGEALGAAHEAGVLHGRLHPGNVLLESGERLRLTDACVATALRCEPATAADDVRDLVAVLYALLTARWPGGCTAQPARGLPPAPVTRRGTCAPRQVRAGVPRALDGVVTAALVPAQSREQPPLRTAADLLTALEQGGTGAAAGSGRRPAGLGPGRLTTLLRR